VELRAGPAAALPLPDGQVDQVFAVNTAAIWPDLDAGLREAARVLRPGGTMVIA
jgi:ubiquinone/menaquinone biosynthesis C-methylase UbiE